MVEENKLSKYFKANHITNRFLAEQTGYSESMVGRYLKDPNLKFILKLIEFYPDIDLNHILKNGPEMEQLKMNEPNPYYGETNAELLDIIQKAMSQLKANLAQN